jgi:hypothetical protein
MALRLQLVIATMFVTSDRLVLSLLVLETFQRQWLLMGSLPTID